MDWLMDAAGTVDQWLESPWALIAGGLVASYAISIGLSRAVYRYVICCDGYESSYRKSEAKGMATVAALLGPGTVAILLVCAIVIAIRSPFLYAHAKLVSWWES